MWDKFLDFHKRHMSHHFSSAASASAMALHLVTGPVVGGLLGYFLDDWLGTDPWLFISLLILGIAAGFKNMYLDAKRLIKSQDDEQHEPERQEKVDGKLDDKADPPSKEG